MSFSEVLGKIGSDLNSHAKLVNTFSLMEYIGARKIMKSQQEVKISEVLLCHVAEELRHAMSLKRLALKLSEGKLVTYEPKFILGEAAAGRYMQTVDWGVSQYFQNKDAWKNYLITTWLIEERALQVYPLYEQVMDSLGHKGFFKMILKDEKKHANFIDRELKPFSLSKQDHLDLLELESGAFVEFTESIWVSNVNVPALLA